MKKTARLILAIASVIAFGTVLVVSGCSVNNAAHKRSFADSAGAGTESDASLDSNSSQYAVYEVYDFINGIAWFRGFDSKGRLYYGVIDEQKNLIVPPVYEAVFSFDFYSRTLTWVLLAETKKWGAIDISGAETAGVAVVPFQYDRVRWQRSDGMTAVSAGGKTGLLDSDGNVRVPVEYEEILDCRDGMAAVMSGGKWGVVDSANNVIVPFGYAWASCFSEGLARVVIADETYRPFQYSAPEEVWLKGKFGFVDMAGNVVVPVKYDYAGHFSNGIATARLDGQYVTIDMSGNITGLLQEKPLPLAD